MANGSLIEELIAGRWRDPATGRAVRIETRAVVIERSLDGGEAELIAPLAARAATGGGRRSQHLRCARGAGCARPGERSPRIDSVVLDAPVADLATVEELRARTTLRRR